jgi:ferric-dicitrate binding protein FerR (iron transport regulator)
MKTNEQILELIHAYFTGQISPADSSYLEDVLNQSPEMLEEFRRMSALYGHLQADFIEKNIHTNEEWQTLIQKLPLENADQNNIVTEKQKENHFTRNYRWMSVAAIITLVLVSSFILFFTLKTSSNIIVFKATDSIQHIQLSDGSGVVLNKGSILISPKKFSGKKRHVVLYGNAYFEVAHKNDFPFIVSSDNVSVKVLGTKFFVNTNFGDKKTEVALTEGRVEVFNDEPGHAKVVLQPGEKIEFPQQGMPGEKTQINDKNFMAWQTGILEFNDARLLDVVSELNRTYKSNIVLENNNIADCRISATFQHQPVDAVIKVIAGTLNLNISKKDAEIVLSGNSCNDSQR